MTHPALFLYSIFIKLTTTKSHIHSIWILPSQTRVGPLATVILPLAMSMAQIAGLIKILVVIIVGYNLLSHEPFR